MTQLDKYDAIIVGAGLTGSVIARHLAVMHGMKVVILEKRRHIAGNLFDFTNQYGIRVQQYGPHVFHTKKPNLFCYMKTFGTWSNYKLQCSVFMNGKYTPSPFNFQTIDDYYCESEASEIKNQLLAMFPERESVTIVELLQCNDKILTNYANFLFENDYRLYTAKQWGISPEEIDVSVLKRVPVLLSYEQAYFNDEYEAMPNDGYTTIIANILRHDNITVELECDAVQRIVINQENSRILVDNKETDQIIVYSGPIDELLGFKHGALPYRSLRFEYDTINTDSYQNTPVVAYPQVPDYTRITEYKKLPPQKVSGYTTIAREYPSPYVIGTDNEPFYPILTDVNQALYDKYYLEVRDVKNLYVCGRLGDYKYYNMDSALERALSICARIDDKITV